MITVYEDPYFQTMEEDIYWNTLFYGTFGLVFLSVMITFSLVIAFLLKKLFLNKNAVMPRNTSVPLVHRHHHRRMVPPGYDECDI